MTGPPHTAEFDLGLVRELWSLGEVAHATYLAPEGRAIYEEAGLRGGWMRYFAARCSPLGEASRDLVVATFYGFHPRLVGRSIPDAWAMSSPARVHSARLSVADVAMRRSFPVMTDESRTMAAAELLKSACDRATIAGRPLFAAHAAMAWPEPAHVRLWWATTLLREYRGDCHIALLVAAGVQPCESLVWHAATGEFDAEGLRSIRGWTEDEWASSRWSLQQRGWLESSGELSDEGRAARQQLERDTDQLAGELWEGHGADLRTALDELAALTAPG